MRPQKKQVMGGSGGKVAPFIFSTYFGANRSKGMDIKRAGARREEADRFPSEGPAVSSQ